MSRTAAQPVIYKSVATPTFDPEIGNSNPGDLWVDLSASLLKRKTANNPDVWVSVEGGGAAINFADGEVPSGAINGINVTFTLAHTPSPALSLELFRNGVLQKGGGVDYTLAVATITFVTAPVTGDSLLAWYRF